MGKLRILSWSEEPFKDRSEAGNLLARELKGLRGKGIVVLGIPRGGIVVAAEMAALLEAELDIVLSHKLGAPGNPELAIGAISEDGEVLLNEGLLSYSGAEESYIQQEKARRLAEIKGRVEQYRRVHPKVSLKGKAVVITDDGVATGATMDAALWAARKEEPKRLISAVPVGPKETLERLTEYADEVICLRVPSYFMAVGQFYRDFEQIGDEEVLRILKEAGQERG